MKIRNFATLIVVVITIMFYGCTSNEERPVDNNLEFKKLSYEHVWESFDSGNECIVIHLEALVRAYPQDGFEKENYVVLHSVDDPKTGGIKWENARLDELKSLLDSAASRNQDVIVRMKCKIEPYVWGGSFGHYSSNSTVDPIAKVNSIDSPKYQIVAKINLPPPDLSKLK